MSRRVHRPPDAREQFLRSVRQIIARNGWAISGHDGVRCDMPGCAGPQCHGSGSERTLLYTVGLTAAGLPELVIEGASTHVATHMLNGLARQSLAAELVPGMVYPPPAPLEGPAVGVEWMSAAETAAVKVARAIYGRSQIRALRVVTPLPG